MLLRDRMVSFHFNSIRFDLMGFMFIDLAGKTSNKRKSSKYKPFSRKKRQNGEYRNLQSTA